MSITGVSAGAQTAAAHAKAANAASAQNPSHQSKIATPHQHLHHAGGLTAGKLTSAGNTPVLDSLV